MAGTVAGLGRAKLRLSRGFPDCPACDVIPQKASSRSFNPTALWHANPRRMGVMVTSVGDRSKGVHCVHPDISLGTGQLVNCIGRHCHAMSERRQSPRICGVTSWNRAQRKTPAQTELRPTCRPASEANSGNPGSDVASPYPMLRPTCACCAAS